MRRREAAIRSAMVSEEKDNPQPELYGKEKPRAHLDSKPVNELEAKGNEVNEMYAHRVPQELEAVIPAGELQDTSVQRNV